VSIGFSADGTFGVGYGCNDGGGSASVRDDQLVVSSLSSTAVGCSTALGRQEELVEALLSGGPTIHLSGAMLEVSGPNLTLRLAEQFDSPLTGPRWMTTAELTPQIFTGSGLKQPLILNADGTWNYRGCAMALACRYTLDGSTIDFVTLATDLVQQPCLRDDVALGQREQVFESMQREEQHVAALLNLSVTFTLELRSLKLSDAGGNAELFHADR